MTNSNARFYSRFKKTRHIGQSHLILRCALKTLDLSDNYPFQILEIPYDPTYRRLTANQIQATEWATLCLALYLPISIIEYGYNAELHINCIFRAWQNGFFHHPHQTSLEKIIRSFNKKYSRTYPISYGNFLYDATQELHFDSLPSAKPIQNRKKV